MLSIVLAGGKGSRLWPESTAQKPKPLLRPTGSETLLTMTINRLKPCGKITVVCSAENLQAIQDELANQTIEVVPEPYGRSTAPAVAIFLADGTIADDEIVGVFPSDHYVASHKSFIETIKAAEPLAREGSLVTIGIMPDKPATAYGYIEYCADHPFKVKAFHEKPDAQQAISYINQGNYYWNSGIFIATAHTWRSLITQHLPEIGVIMLQGRTACLNAYLEMESISIDYGIAEKAANLAVIKGDFGWSDIGSWDSLAELMTKDVAGNSLQGKALAIETQNCLVRSSDKEVVLFGVHDLIVIETDRHILICPQDRAQDIKKITLAADQGIPR